MVMAAARTPARDSAEMGAELRYKIPLPVQRRSRTHTVRRAPYTDKPVVARRGQQRPLWAPRDGGGSSLTREEIICCP
jgi:hypothetical protein